MASWIWLVPVLPLAGVLVNGLLGRRLGKRAVSLIGPGVVGAAFAAALVIFLALLGRPADDRTLSQTLYTWLSAGDFSATVGFLVDPLSATLMLVVTGVGFLIHVYSAGYMHAEDDAGFARYFAYLNLFTFAMLLLVMADNFLLLFVGWEGVGLCSYLLIGFWFKERENAEAGKKAFIVNRIGDFGFLLGIFLIFGTFGSVAFADVLPEAADTLAPGGDLAYWICLLLFVGAVGKSAQIPLYVWLPDAMAGPTPVSALIHAATMVTAGVYMIARAHALYLMAPAILAVVAGIGALTALYAATIGLAQTDIKKVLAYSTISQLGYMFLGVGVGAFTAGIFHLVTHSFFKALLFLGAGSVIHALHGEQDMRRMGGLKADLPVTYWTILLATLAIAGIPPLAGFFSKDEILWRVWEAGHPALWVIGFATAGLTALYMFRLFFLTFHGGFRGPTEARAHVHESPPSMAIPLVVLGALSVFGGWIGLPHALGGPLGGIPNAFEEWLAPVFHAAAEIHGAAPGGGGTAADGAAHGAPAIEYALMAASVAVALLGILLAWSLYVRNPALPAVLSARSRGLHRLVRDKYYVDEIYAALVVRPFDALSRFAWRAVDDGLIDGLGVRGTGWLVGLGSRVASRWQSGYVQGYVVVFFGGVVAILAYYLFGG
ncbi:MAG TPA: NADH-quinone oxidoreductase subunit L [Gemmatimonadota bacterium]|nr:NADH-quinone oxidoreductase subunit L [Gemmatimonadota bacterium]